MGGSGGGLFPGYKNENRIKKMIEEAVVKTRNDAYETAVTERLNELLVHYNDRNTEKTRIYLDQIRSSLQEDIEGSVDLRFGGSVQKHTYVDGLSDVDCLVQLKGVQPQSMNPKDALDYFRQKLEQRLGRLVRVSVGNLAVTLEYPDGTKIQLLPAINRGTGVMIPSGKADEWSRIIRPEKFAEKLTEVNKALSGKVVPTIKLAKASINEILSESDRLTGYHVESLAVEIFKSYRGPTTTKAMLEHFFEKAQQLVKQNIKDKTGQSVHVDDYLGSEGSPTRDRISQRLGYVLGNLKKANLTADRNSWLQTIGEQ